MSKNRDKVKLLHWSDHPNVTTDRHLVTLPQQVNPAPTLPGNQPGRSRQTAEGGGTGGRVVHALTYVLSIEIALTVTVLCREASREKRG